MLAFFGFFLIFTFLYASVNATLIAKIYGMDISEVPLFLENNSSVQAVFQFFSQLFVFGFPPLLFMFVFWGNIKTALFSQKLEKKSLLIILMFLLLVVSFPALNLLENWNQNLTLPGFLADFEAYWRNIEAQNERILQKFLLNTSWLVFFRNIFIMAIVPAVCEELFFRGALQQILFSIVKRKHFTVFLTAIVFTLFHFEPFVFLPRFLLALFLGYLFFDSKNLLSTMIFHFLNNVIIVVFYFLYSKKILDFNPDVPVNFHWAVSLLSVLLCAAVAFFLFSFVLKREKNSVKNIFSRNR